MRADSVTFDEMIMIIVLY